MATTKALRFYRATVLPSTANSAAQGDIYFIKPSSGDGQIYVCTSLDSSSIPQFVKYADAYTHPNVSRSNTTSTASPTHGGTFTAIDSITTNSQGHVTAAVTKTVTLPAETALNITQSGSGGYISGVTKGTGSHDITVTHTALPTISVTSGAAETNKYISAISASGHTITVTKASLPSGTGGKSAAAGEYINAVSLSGHTLTAGTGSFVTDIASNGTSTTAPTTKAVKEYVDSAITSAIHIKGTIGSTGATVTTLPTTNVVVGDAYVVKTAGTYADQKCEVGDIIICTASTPTWTVIQNNLDVATDTKLGTIKIGYTTSGKNYAVQLDSNNKAYVNVPWVDTNTDTHYTNYLQIKGNNTEAVKFTQNADKSLNFAPGDNVTITATSGTITIAAKDTHYTAAHTIKVGDTTVTTFAQSAAKTTTFAAGSSGKLTVSGTTSGTVTYDHNTITTSKGSEADLTPGYGSNFTYISSITADGYGHITGYKTQKVTLPSQYSLPTASTSTKGGIKIGTSLEMSGEVCNVVWTDFGS